MRLAPSALIAAEVSLAALGAYLLVAYFIAPEIWILRDARRVPQFGHMVTTTEEDIPGDPINVGLVGSKEQVIRAFARAQWDPTDAIALRSSIDIVLGRPDPNAPVSTLIFRGQKTRFGVRKAWWKQR